MRIVWTATVLLLMSAPVFSADSTKWGLPVSGLRLGIDFGSEPSRPELHATLQNVGTMSAHVIIGANKTLPFQFLATARNGKTLEGFELNSFGSGGGLIVPVAILLQPGATHEWHVPLERIIVIDVPRTFEDLVRERSSIEISLDSQGGLMCPARPAQCWAGTVTSGRITDSGPGIPEDVRDKIYDLY